jgi:hypothetical protein
MTSFWRLLVLLVAGLGATWAVTRVGDGPPTVFNTLDDAAPADEAAPGAAEVEAQIRAAEEALGERADPNQELPVDPLRADVAIALPSDI